MAARRTHATRAARRRKRRLSLVVNDLTTDQWDALREAWGGCAYCGVSGVPVQRDCLLPVSRGGRYTLSNVVPACASCNTSKWNTEVTTWIRRRHLDERSFLLRHAAIQEQLDGESARQGH